MNIRTKLMVLFLTLSIVPLLVMVGLSFNNFEKTLTENEFNHLESIAVIFEKIVGEIAQKDKSIQEEEVSALTSSYTGQTNTGELVIARENEQGGAEFLHGLRFQGAATAVPSVPKERLDVPITQALAGNEDVFAKTVDYRGVEVLAATKYVEEADLGLVVKIDKSEAFEPIDQLLRSHLIVGFILVFLSGIFSVFVSRKITQPLVQLQSAAQSLQRGDFTSRINLSTGDEMEELADTFNKASQALSRIEEEKQQIDKAKTEFLSITSHELRSPMTPMKAQLQMVLGGYFGKITKKQRESLEIILRNTERLDRIIMDFLEISRIEAARLKFNFVKTNIKEHVERLVEEMKGFLPEKNIAIKTEIGRLPTILVDPDRTMQVLRNLINNAKKFSPKESTIELGVISKKDGIEFSVKDAGMGISKKDQERIFEPFFQAEKTIYREHQGTGLGLAICRGIVESQGKKLTVRSTPGKGTTFTFSVPLTPVRKAKSIKLLFSKKLAKKR